MVNLITTAIVMVNLITASRNGNPNRYLDVLSVKTYIRTPNSKEMTDIGRRVIPSLTLPPRSPLPSVAWWLTQLLVVQRAFGPS